MFLTENIRYVKSYLSNYPRIYSILQYLSSYYYLFLRKIDRLRAKIEFYLGPRPRIDPLKLYWVNPNKINKTSGDNNFSSYFLSPIISGNWDIETINLEEIDIFSSFEQHFRDDKAWENTKLYSREIKYLDEEKEWDGRDFSDEEEVKSYLEDKDRLFREIKQNGYRTQKSLASEDNIQFWVPSSRALERNEITVNVGRNGDFILEDGYHRLAIAQILGLDVVPVRIAARHSEWQEKRKEIMKSNEFEEINHPDLIELI